MVYFLGGVLATFITVPYLLFFIVQISMLKITRKRKKAIKISADITTLFLYFSVLRLCIEIWGHSYYWILILLFLGCSAILSYIIWKNDWELTMARILKINWRLHFFILSLCYFSLMAYGIMMRILAV